MKRTPLVLIALSAMLVGVLSSIPRTAQAAPACDKTASPPGPGVPGLQAVIIAAANNHGPGAVVCVESGAYTISASLRLPVPMTVVGIGATRPIIECEAEVYCFDGSAGPDYVTLQNLELDGAQKADIQIGTGGGTTVSSWVLSQITATGGGQAGIAINNAADIDISESTIDSNGSSPYSSNPSGVFGLRAATVDRLTVEDSTISNNPVTSAMDTNNGFAGGAKFNTNTNLLVQNNVFSGNAGGAQLWVDIDSHDFQVLHNTIVEQPNAVTSLLAPDRIRVEVSCGGLGSSVGSNTLTVPPGTQVPNDVAGIDLFDSSGITVENNVVTVPHLSGPGTNFGIRMLGNQHGQQLFHDCEPAPDVYPNQNNVARGNTIDVTATGSAFDGVVNTDTGISTGNSWSDNVYTMRHCDDGPIPQWTWWDGTSNNLVDYTGWQGLGQDVGGSSSCTPVYPEITSFSPTGGPAGTSVTITGTALAGATSVTFNRLSAAITQDTDTEIIATVPARATTGPICVVTPASNWCTIGDNFTVTSLVPSAPQGLSPATRFRLTPFSATWSPSQGATAYDARWRSAPLSGGFPTTWNDYPTSGTTTPLLPFRPGNTTCFSVTALNGSGSSAAAQGCTSAPLDDRRLRIAKGPWRRGSAPRFYLGTATSTKVQGASLSFSGIQTRAIALVLETRPGGGAVDVLWNGRLLRRVSTAAGALRDRRIIPIAAWTGLHSGTITIRVHTAAKTVVIDGLGLSRV